MVFAAVQIVTLSDGNLFAVGGNMGNGSGTESDPYLIEDFADFTVFASDPNYWASGIYTQLTKDLDLYPDLPGRQIYTSAVIAPDPNYEIPGFNGIPFSGVFNGNDYMIDYLTIDASGEGNGYIGLFGLVRSDGVVKNLRLTNVGVTCTNHLYVLSTLAGSNFGAIINCYSEGSIIGGSTLGGLIGFNSGSITDCHTNCSVNGGVNLGGLVAKNYNQITRCSTGGSISGLQIIGGLVAENQGTISQCYASSSVSGRRKIGGLVGTQEADSENYVINESYSTGTVEGLFDSERIGGLLGHFQTGQVTECYSSSQLTLANQSKYCGGLIGTLSGGREISKCYTTGSIISGNNSYSIGCLIGSTGGTIKKCYSLGSVTCGNDSVNVGGLLGSGGSISECYAHGSVSVGDNCNNIGGLVGRSTMVTEGYSIGGIHYGNNSNSVGGLVGSGDESHITNSFWDMETSGMQISAGGQGLPTIYMQNKMIYVFAGWDFNTVWNIVNGSKYPYFQFQPGFILCGDINHPYPIGDLNQDCIVNILDIALVAEHWLEDNRP